jgi:transposase
LARPYPQDLRERMVWAVLSGQYRHEVARMFDVSASCVIKLMQRVDATGDCQPRKFGGHKRYALAEHEDKARACCGKTRSDDHRTNGRRSPRMGSRWGGRRSRDFCCICN